MALWPLSSRNISLEIWSSVDNGFVDWLRQWLVDQDWSQNRLAEASGLSSSQMSRIINGGRVSPEVAAKLAPVLHLPEQTILEMAGRVRARPPANARIDQLVALFLQMDEEAQEDELATLRLRVERRKRGTNAKRSASSAGS